MQSAVSGDATANTISESVADGAAVGITALATDPDATDTVTCDRRCRRIAIDAATGVVTVADASLLDYETATRTPSPCWQRRWLDLDPDVHDRPHRRRRRPRSVRSDGDATANTISESVADGAAVGITAPADADATDTVSYSLTDDAGGLAIDAATGAPSPTPRCSTMRRRPPRSRASTRWPTSTRPSPSERRQSEAAVGAVSDGDATANTISERRRRGGRDHRAGPMPTPPTR
ncbi:MAG: hypothetical protein R3F55_21800 [Alphaproteobacteria bacterium]